MNTERMIRIIAGSFILISLALGVPASPLFVSQYWLVVYGVRWREPAAERVHPLLLDGDHSAEARRPVGGAIGSQRDGLGCRNSVSRLERVGEIRLYPVLRRSQAGHRVSRAPPAEGQSNVAMPYAHRPLSISLWTVSIGLRRPPSEFGVRHYSTLILPAWMKALSGLRETAAVMAEPGGKRLPAYAFVDYHQIDSGLNESGPYLGSFCGIDRPNNWTGLSAKEKSERKERWMDRLIADLDREFPGIASAVVHREMATAAFGLALLVYLARHGALNGGAVAQQDVELAAAKTGLPRRARIRAGTRRGWLMDTPASAGSA